MIRQETIIKRMILKTALSLLFVTIYCVCSLRKQPSFAPLGPGAKKDDCFRKLLCV